jgi:hypothetical protein
VIAEAPPAPAPTAPAPPAITHPIESSPAAQDVAAAPQESSLAAAVTSLVGQKLARGMLQLDDFPRRIVATVDNLGRTHAPSRLWPVNPSPGRFQVDKSGAIGADNGLRYTPFVLMVEKLDVRQAAALYVRFYPQFQQAYEELGYPKRYFNDRLVQVIDQLLLTPEPDEPLRVHLPPIQGPMQPERPWVLYEFDDPALQALPAGQKLLLRVGPVNERRLKARLAEFRKAIAATPAGR